MTPTMTTTFPCKICGGTLRRDKNNPRIYRCGGCRTEYNEEEAERHKETLLEALHRVEKERDLEHFLNLRNRLYQTVTAEYISRTEVLHACDEVQSFLADDFAANFYRVASGTNTRDLRQAVRDIQTADQYKHLPQIMPFLIKSLVNDQEYWEELNDLLERAYRESDPTTCDDYIDQLWDMAERVEDETYVPTVPRAVFIACSRRDLVEAAEVVKRLESQKPKITCFFPERNLWRGVGSVENYEANLKAAMDHCKVFLFVSSMASRNRDCDALGIELEYIREKDRHQIATVEDYSDYRGRKYGDVPAYCKIPRVQYHIQNSTRRNPADRTVNEFFTGFTTVEDLASLVNEVKVQKDFINPLELYRRANQLFEQHSYIASIELYRQAAVQGHLNSQTKLGSIYEDGIEGYIAQNLRESFKWYLMAAEQGDAGAAYQVGCYYNIPAVGCQNPEEALRWYRIAAANGIRLAQNRMGLIASQNHNDAEAVRWFLQAAEQGLDVAQFNLAGMYRDGRGVEKNREKAIHWYREAVNNGHPYALQELQKMGVSC